MSWKSQEKGAAFEMRIERAFHAEGLFCRKMPAGSGFDFLAQLPGSDTLTALEAKDLADSTLRLKNITAAELRALEDMREAGITAYIIFPALGCLYLAEWAWIREHLAPGKGVNLLDTHKHSWYLDFGKLEAAL